MAEVQAKVVRFVVWHPEQAWARSGADEAMAWSIASRKLLAGFKGPPDIDRLKANGWLCSEVHSNAR